MGSSNDQPYKNELVWIPISSNANKQILQNKQNRRFIQKHWWKFENLEEANKLNWVYQWRCNKKKVSHPIEIFSMGFEDPAVQGSKGCGYDLCVNAEVGTQIVIYTEKVYKLYEYNPKIEITHEQQMEIFIDIIESIECLSKKFGMFQISKQMIGYTVQKQGRAWYNDNFARNDIQKKYQTQGQEIKAQWQSKIVQNIVDIASMCVNSKSTYQSKFNHAINQIKSKRMWTFNSIKKNRKRKDKLSKQKNANQSLMKQRNKSKSPINQLQKKESQLQFQSDQPKIISGIDPSSSTTRIGPHEKESSRHEIRESTTKMVIIPVTQTKKIYPISNIDSPVYVRRTYHHPEYKSLISSSPAQNILENTFSQTPDNRQSGNLVKIHNRGLSNQSEFEPSLRQHSQQYNKHNPNRNSHQNLKQHRNGPILQKIDQEASMINRLEEDQQSIKMVDSMIFVGEEEISSKSERGRSRMVLQESIILRGIIH